LTQDSRTTGDGSARSTVEVVAGLADRAPDGVWLVELAPLRAAGRWPTPWPRPSASAASSSSLRGGDR
jgi:hypothetical protein